LRPAQAKSSREPVSNNKKLGMMAHVCYPSYLGNKNRRITVQASLDIGEHYLKNNQSRTGRVGQAVKVFA
jgi:hypothetical protein